MSPSSRPTSVDLVADALRAAILGGTLAPGTPLREEQLASEHEVSRHTVRAALNRLDAERLLRSEPYRGMWVASLDADELRTLQDLRVALESEAVRIIGAAHPDGWPTETLADARAALARITDDQPWTSIERAHADLHLAIVAAAGSPRLLEAYQALTSELHLLMLHARLIYDSARLVADHTDYLAAIQRDGPRAVRPHMDDLTHQLIAARNAE